MSEAHAVSLTPPGASRVRPQPAKSIIVGEGRTITDVALEVRVNPHTFGQVLNRRVKAWPALRARLAEVLDRPEDELFDDLDGVR